MIMTLFLKTFSFTAFYTFTFYTLFSLYCSFAGRQALPSRCCSSSPGLSLCFSVSSYNFRCTQWWYIYIYYFGSL